MTRSRIASAAASIAAVLLALPGPAAGAAPKAAAPCEVRAEDLNFFRDNGLTVKLGGRLQFDKLLLREKIEAKVSGGVAVLSGNVSAPAMIETAGRIAAETSGIRCVQNYLKVGPPLDASSN